MKRDPLAIVQILERIEGSDDRRLFFDGEAQWPDGEISYARPGWSDTDAFHVDLMLEDGLIRREVESGEPWQSVGELDTYLQITVLGHDFLEDLRTNTRARKFGRVTVSFFDRVFSSVIAPIVVSVLTVFVMRYLGLVGGG